MSCTTLRSDQLLMLVVLLTGEGLETFAAGGLTLL